MQHRLRRIILPLACVLASLTIVFGDTAYAQGPATPTVHDTASSIQKRRQDMALVRKLGVMPYATLSYNLQSGQAFPKSAAGVGYGLGIAFDFAPDRQPLGLYIDFAYQDMRASSNDGACKLIHPQTDTIAVTVPVTHYFSYALMEVFAKLQSPRTNGYFLIGLSAGISTTSLTDKQGPGVDEYSEWGPTTEYHKVRLDLRAGLGFRLAQISTHDLIFEARFGYPLTTVLSDYQDVCNGSEAHGPWRIVTLQGNLGLRL
ncbi:MAG: hypothetical protein JSS75_08775 [Bacteroidetes bacterium]|nr:hypothetical protein [Bacteroidota bacterium]